ncbi:uncharacterized protein TM35_000321690 [Trypanosoma theileri]|uniref:Uncharacterized protein n=1 Tax=Trypanosoma theileri TaxID=67003 RepID=A0A1X0NM85_9TRYP|nr:uncharacterized protein TM35_000321690 [Trypanosoma theileri]ORC85854.1 hypothetical protein TM35_000321690 [Trypanosoma theileri]
MVGGGNPHGSAAGLTNSKNNTSNSNNNISNSINTNTNLLRPAVLGLKLDTPTVSGEPHEASQHHRAKTVQEIVDAEDKEADVAVVGRCCTTIFLPILLFILVAGTFVDVVYTSGGSPEVAGVPRAVLFIVEGFKGTTFTSLLEQQRLPHLRRMLAEQQGIYAICTTVEDARCARAAVVEDDTTGESYISAAAGMANILTGVSPHRHRVRNDSSNAFNIFTETSTQFPSVAMRATKAGLRVLGLGGSHLLNGLVPTTGQCGEVGILDAECAAAGSSTSTPNKVNGETTPLSGFHFNNNNNNDNNNNNNPTTATRREKSDERSEGGVSSMMSCLHQRSCNLFQRILTLSGGRDGKEERVFTEQLLDIFGGLFSEEHEGSGGNNNFDNSLLIFHFNALARRTEDPELPEFTYDKDSLEYAAQAFLIDSLIGQVLTFIRDRAYAKKENWLVVGTSDHGGVGKSFGHSGDEDEVVPFFVATYTSNSRGYIKLKPLLRPATHMDTTPTILKWLGLPPYEEQEEEEEEEKREKEYVAEGGISGGVNSDRKSRQYSNDNNNARMGSTQPVSTTSLASTVLLDGRPQAICGSGLRPRDCPEEK